MSGTNLSDVRDAFMGKPLTEMLHESTLGKPECSTVLDKLSQAGCITVSHWLLEEFGAKGRSLSQDDLAEFLADRHGLEIVENPTAANPDPNVVVPADSKHLKVFKEIGINVRLGSLSWARRPWWRPSPPRGRAPPNRTRRATPRRSSPSSAGATSA